MLRSAVVGALGRGLPVRLLTWGLVLLIATLSSSVGAQAPLPSAFDDLIPDLAARVISALSAGAQASLTVEPGIDGEEAQAIRSRMTMLLAAHGVRITDATAGIAAVAIGCGRNLRERVCVAKIADGRTQIVTVTGRRTSSTMTARTAVPALELRPLLSQQIQILDAAVIGDRLLVLDVAAITLFERKDGEWRIGQSRPLPVSRPWPRDPRGRLRASGNRVDLFLPAKTCTGRLDPHEISCTDGQQPWPIGMDNKGLEPGRNYFKTPEGTVFYNAAPLGAAANDDATGLAAACAPGMYVAAVSPSGRLDSGDLLQLSRVADGRLVQAASPVSLPGVLTALWAQPDQTSAVVVTHDVRAGRYDAFQTTISCSR